ncbi:hypothetical protein J2S21_001824 [Peribacillus cavernae]|nr:hypothetical protein [Peribacillus cavernae]
MDLFTQIHEHEQLMFCNDPSSGLKHYVKNCFLQEGNDE